MNTYPVLYHKQPAHGPFITDYAIALVPEPPEDLVLPPVDTSSASFLSIFYSRDVGTNPEVAALVVPSSEGQLFYIDLNNDEDLTDDGPPILFRFDENAITFFLHSRRDPEQRTGRLLQRIPRFALADSLEMERFKRFMLDGSENLRPDKMMLWQDHNPGMTGAKDTFFFDDYLDVSRGTLNLDGVQYTIGLYDYNQNGRFDDMGSGHDLRTADRFIIDLDQDGRLTSTTTSEIFKLNDVFQVGGKRYKLQQVDPYGRSVSLIETREALTFYYVSGLAALNGAQSVQYGQLDEGFWDLVLPTTGGDVLNMSDLRGRYVLLNFWGEWCAPCIAEAPLLVAERKQYPATQLSIIGMLLTDNLAAAETVVRGEGMAWPQVVLTDELLEQFKVSSYPTNILVFPDGRTFVQTGAVSDRFFRQNVR